MAGLDRKQLENIFHKHFFECLRKLQSPDNGGGVIVKETNKLTGDSMTGMLIGFTIASMLDTISENNGAI